MRRCDGAYRKVSVQLWCAFVVGLLLPASARSDDSPAPLFDGQSLDGWATLDGQPVTKGWEVVDGVIHLPASDERSGHIITARDVGNFVLSFDFKIAPNGNSGIKYRVQDINGKILGCEYQVFDDDHPKYQIEPKNSTGSLYDVYEPVADKPLNPAGEYNSAKIVVQNEMIEHWLNGRLIVRAIVGSSEWYRRLAESKFNDDPGFGLNRFGKLMLTDHGSEVWYRNFELIELPTDPVPSAPWLALSSPCVSGYAVACLSCDPHADDCRIECHPIATCTVSTPRSFRRSRMVRRCRWSRR